MLYKKPLKTYIAYHVLKEKWLEIQAYSLKQAKYNNRNVQLIHWSLK